MITFSYSFFAFLGSLLLLLVDCPIVTWPCDMYRNMAKLHVTKPTCGFVTCIELPGFIFGATFLCLVGYRLLVYTMLLYFHAYIITHPQLQPSDKTMFPSCPFKINRAQLSAQGNALETTFILYFHTLLLSLAMSVKARCGFAAMHCVERGFVTTCLALP